MAAIPGHIRNEVVVIGNHRDGESLVCLYFLDHFSQRSSHLAWVLGAADPISGTASMLEIVRAFGELHKKGWQPMRTILFASWDAEEYGLIGSTEWGEDFARWISKHVVTYLNGDTSSSGSRFGVQASPSLAHLIRQTAQDLDHPTEAGRSLWDARTDTGKFPAPAGHVEEQFETLSEGVRPLGSGSDYTVFLQRLGVSFSHLILCTCSALMVEHRLPVLTLGLAQLCKTRCITTTPSLTPNASKSFTPIQDSTAMYVTYFLALFAQIVDTRVFRSQSPSSSGFLL